MVKNNRIAVVVPAHNEEKLIASTILGIPEYVDSIVAIDDSSTDKTYDRLKSLQAANDKLTIVRHEVNRGVGGSIISGYRRLFEQDVDIAVVMAGDNQMDPQYLPLLLDRIIDEGFDIAKGNRFTHRRQLAAMPAYRRIGNFFWSLLTKAASGYWSVFDSSNGYVASRAPILKQVDLDHVSNGFDFEADMLIHLNILQAKVGDVSIPAVYGTEASDLRVWKVVPGFLWTLLRGFWYRVHRRYGFPSAHPVAVFLFAGMALMAVGVALGIAAALAADGDRWATSAILAVASFNLGLLSSLAALVIDGRNEPK